MIVSESDADRAFYQEVNERLLKVNRGVRNCLFLNAQNKQTTRLIAKPLRELGIPTAMIVDIDILKEGGTVWSDFLNAAGIPEIDRRSMATTRESLMTIVRQDNLNLKRDGGVQSFRSANQESVKNLLRSLASYGAFVVAGGELESWLKPMGAQGHGPAWLISMFEKMGEDVGSADYVRPSAGDVWDFVDEVGKWCQNANRAGMSF